MGAMPMIAMMQATGLEVDLDHFAQMDKGLSDDLERITEEIHQISGHYINPGSGDQVAELLFSKLKLKQARPKMTSSGERESVEDAVLTAIQHDHPVVPKLLDYKEYEKLRGTYVRPMPKLARRMGTSWRMFPNFRTTRVPSGRLSCSDPNLLAMPTRTEKGREVRKGFITRPGWKIVSVDESQIEVRIAAHRSADPNLLKVYHNEEDIYSDFAIAAFRLPDNRYKEDKWKYPGVHAMDHRRPSKVCVLASIYDVTAKGLLEQMPIVCANCNKEATKHDCRKFYALWTEGKCQDLINAFYMKYPGLLNMRKRDHAYIRRNGYICDMWGRLQHITAVKSVLEWVQAAALREGSNLPMQGGAQGTIKLVMAAVMDDLLSIPGIWDICHVLLQVHDELLFECREDFVEDLIALVKFRFETMFNFLIPIKASGAFADTWGDLDK
jgi:DNA polymerase-1